MSEEKIINPKPPTKRDLQVLAYLNEGNYIDSAKALGLFKTTGLRDILYRLRQAGHVILHRDISYQTKDGENKYYRQWYTCDPLIPETGVKTQKTERSLKGKSVSDFSRKIEDISKNRQLALL